MTTYRNIHGKIVEYRALTASEIDDLIDNAEQGVKDFLFFGKANNSPRKGSIFSHYTSVKALDGILKSKEFWLTDAQDTNDKTEINHGYDLFFKLLEEAKKRYVRRKKKFEEDVCETIYLRLKPILTTFGPSTYFVGSLSSAKDDLTQWRLYGDHGKGVQIDFCLEGFSGEQVLGVKVNYSETTVREYQAKILKFAIRFVGKIYRMIPESKSEHKRLHIRVFGKIANAILTNAVASKHPSFIAEKELRLVRVGRPPPVGNVFTRTLRGKTVKYVPMALDLGKAIVGVKLGPLASDRDVAKVKKLLSKAMLGEVVVARSDLPYRG